MAEGMGFLYDGGEAWQEQRGRGILLNKDSELLAFLPSAGAPKATETPWHAARRLMLVKKQEQEHCRRTGSLSKLLLLSRREEDLLGELGNLEET